MVPDPGANLALQEFDVPTDEFAAGDHLHVSGYALLRDSRDAGAARAGGRGRRRDDGLRRRGLGRPARSCSAPSRSSSCCPADDAALRQREGGGRPHRPRRHGGGAGRPPLAGDGRQVVVTAGSGDAAWSDGSDARDDGRRAARPARARHHRRRRRVRRRLPGRARPRRRHPRCACATATPSPPPPAGRRVVAPRRDRVERMELRIFVEPQQGATYDDQLAVARTAEELGFGAFFRSDHYLAMGGDGLPGPTDSWVTLGRPRARDDHDPARHDGDLGDLPLPRPAGDRGRPGRPDERRPCRARHRRRLVRRRAPGVRDPVPADRRALRPARGPAGASSPACGRHREGETFSYDGTHSPVVDSPGLPKPAQQPHPPIIIGGKGAKRTPALAARYADEFNMPFAAVETSAGAARPGPRRVRGDRPRPGDAGLLRRAHRCCGADEDDACSGRAGPPAARSTTCARTASPARPQEVVDTIGRYAELGVERVYLQVLDLATSTTSSCSAAEVMSRLR